MVTECRENETSISWLSHGAHISRRRVLLANSTYLCSSWALCVLHVRSRLLYVGHCCAVVCIPAAVFTQRTTSDDICSVSHGAWSSFTGTTLERWLLDCLTAATKQFRFLGSTLRPCAGAEAGDHVCTGNSSVTRVSHTAAAPAFDYGFRVTLEVSHQRKSNGDYKLENKQWLASDKSTRACRVASLVYYAIPRRANYTLGVAISFRCCCCCCCSVPCCTTAEILLVILLSTLRIRWRKKNCSWQ